MGVENLLEGLDKVTGNELEQLAALKELNENLITKIAEDEANLNQVNCKEFSPRGFEIFNFHCSYKFAK